MMFVFRAAGYFVARTFVNSPLWSLIVMWTPGVAALVASAITRRPLKAIGWWPGHPKWLAAGWLFPLLYAFPAYALIWITGLGSVPSATFLQRARLTLDMPTQPDWLVIVSAFFFISLLRLPPAMLFSLAVGHTRH